MPKKRLPKHILNLFPNLNSLNHYVTSPADIRYNCAAWAANDTTKTNTTDSDHGARKKTPASCIVLPSHAATTLPG